MGGFARKCWHFQESFGLASFNTNNGMQKMCACLVVARRPGGGEEGGGGGDFKRDDPIVEGIGPALCADFWY